MLTLQFNGVFMIIKHGYYRCDALFCICLCTFYIEEKIYYNVTTQIPLQAMKKWSKLYDLVPDHF